jgi:hypothetical protein
MMYETPSPSTPFYRATKKGTTWRKLLQGHGAFYTDGGRYNTTHQPTVYTADDPVVAISEQAFYQAKTWQQTIGSRLKPYLRFPLVTEHLLWCFTLDNPPQILDLTNDVSRQVFTYYRFALLNPSLHHQATRELADNVRKHPNATAPNVGGLKAPSVRAIPVGGGYACQTVLFPGPKGIKASRVGRLNLTLEFLDGSGHSVDGETAVINWSDLRFQLHGGTATIPLDSACRGGTPIPIGDWIPLTIRHG